MAIVIEDTVGKIRDLPIADKLRQILVAAGTIAGVDVVRVVSGGQCRKGTCTKRTGSTRHDLGNSADLDIEKGGKALDYTKSAERPIFEKFITACASLGATGIGAGPGYMGGKHRMHIGFGGKAIWGAGGKASNAPDWVKAAVNAGWNNPQDINSIDLGTASGSRAAKGRFSVTARPGLNLRGGPGTSFATLVTLAEGTVVHAVELHGDWLQIDLEGDGMADGFVHRAFLLQLEEPEDPAGESDDTEATPRFEVIARPGLNLRGGPATTFAKLDTLAAGAIVFGLEQIDEWLQIDVQGDGVPDGFVHTAFLRELAPDE